MGLTIGLTYDLKTDWQPGPNDPVDANAELDSPKTIDRLAEVFTGAGHRVKKIGNVHNLLKNMDDLGVDIVFNIAEGRKTRNRESQVPILLELKGVPCVGSDALTLGISLDKVATKKMMIADNIPTPKYFHAWYTDDLKKMNTFGYPLIVKARYEGTSKGLTDSSRVTDLAGLKCQVELINRNYNQTALVEEFIRGTEFTVPVIGNEDPEAMPVCQVTIDGSGNLGDQFFTFERVSAKNLQYDCPAKISASLAKKMQELAIAVYKNLECLDFGRVDFRVDEKGNPYVLEINPLPSLAEVDVFNIFPNVIGSSYEKIINQILNFGIARYNLNGHAKQARTDKSTKRGHLVQHVKMS